MLTISLKRFQWEDDMGITRKSSKVLDFGAGAENEEYYETMAIRKAIALVNYTDFVQYVDNC